MLQQDLPQCQRPTSKNDDQPSFYNSSQPTCVLTIAGSDSGGGAGIQADLNTFSAHQVFGTSVVAALTAQNSCGVQGVFPIPSDFVLKQLESVLVDFPIKAVKTGMLHNSEIIQSVANRLKGTDLKIVLDPVMVSTSGSVLLENDAVQALLKDLFPISHIVTPNIPEAEAILQFIGVQEAQISTVEEMKGAAIQIAKELKPKYVLIKGGHLQTEDKQAIDILYDRSNDQIHTFTSEFLQSNNTHGTGCCLSAAICANLALGHTTEESVSRAKQYVTDAISMGFRVGKGKHGTLRHMWSDQR